MGFTSIAVPVAYAFVAGAGEFVSSWGAKGGRKGTLRIWTNEDESSLTLQTGGIERLVALYQTGRDIAFVEPAVYFSLSRFSSLGLNLGLGAIAISIAWFIDGTVSGTYLIASLAVQVVMSFAAYMAMQVNKGTRPDQASLAKRSTFAATFFGLFAMFLSFLALNFGQ